MVEIKINTDTSSKEDIRRAVEFLKKYIEMEAMKEPDYNVSGSAMDIFDDSSPTLKPDPDPQPQPEPEIKEDEDTDIKIKPIFY